MNSSRSNPSTLHTSLLMRVKQDDPQAWQQLVQLYGPLVYHWGQVCKLSKADAADVMQEVMLAVSRKVASFQVSKGSFRGWLWRISQNKIRDHFRKLARQPASPGGSTALRQFAQIPELESTDDPTSPLESHRLLHRALNQIQDQFNANTWQAFWKTTVESQDTRSVAEALKMSQNHVRQAKSRVLRRLREQLNDPDL